MHGVDMPSVEYLGVSKPINKISPLLSVCIPTYQHAGFIAECLDSVLSQKVSFPFEILIGEDQSEDGTREICIAYADKFPDKIRLFLNDREDVIYIDGRPTGRTNFLNLYSESRGKFIALCEGDDYWTDNTKLEQQVEIFQKTPECSLVFHNAIMLRDGGEEQKFSSDLVEGFYDIESVISKPWFVPTQSIVFRKDMLELGAWAKHVYNLDYAIQLMLATKYPFYFIDKIMSVYRIHEGGSGQGRKIFYHPIKVIETLSVFNCLSEFKYDHLIKKRVDDLRGEMANTLEHARQNNLKSSVLNMSYLEKLLTFRFYIYVIEHFTRKIRDKWNDQCKRCSNL